MSLYANINVSKTQAENVTANKTPAKSSKSAALYAGVLSKPPLPAKALPQHKQPSPQAIPQPVEIEPEQPKQASGILQLPQITNPSPPIQTHHPKNPQTYKTKSHTHTCTHRSHSLNHEIIPPGCV
jgi:hypothetical protein